MSDRVPSGAGGRGTTVIVLSILLVGLLSTLPWLGIGYCLFIGGSACPVILPPQVAQRPVQPTPANDIVSVRGGRGPDGVPVSGAQGLGGTSADYIALVIGNSAYTPPNDLNNPRNDAQDVAAALKDLGYTLMGGTAHFDVETKRDMLALLDQFSVQAEAAKVALIYYAGHGVQYQGENYLIPTKATLKSARQLNLQTVSMREINSALPAQKISIVIFDACRSPPSFPLADDEGRSRGNDTRGFAVVRAPNRSYFAFSSSSGEPAKDGAGRNSPYVARLLQRMREPGIEVEKVFKKVQDDFRESDNRQRPDNSDQLGVVEVPFAPALPLPPVGTEFRDCPDCPLMVVVPKGKFLMGAPKTEEGSEDDERPQHEVTIPNDFAVGKFEVTFAEYDACVLAGGCIERPDEFGWGRGSRPVIFMNWSDAQTYVRWLNGKLGRNRGKYRLLTEAEWEYAARAGTTTAYPWGAEANHDFANYGKDECCAGLTQGKDKWGDETAPVGSFPANRFGLYDMHGNVFEWTEDCWNKNYTGAPTDSKAWTKGECNTRMMRGGSWKNHPLFLRSAVRYGYYSGDRSANFGFRLARTN